MKEKQNLKVKSMIDNWVSEIEVHPDERAENRRIFVKARKSI